MTAETLLLPFANLLPPLLAAIFLLFLKDKKKKFAIFFLYGFANILFFLFHVDRQMDFVKLSFVSLFPNLLIIYLFCFCSRSELLVKYDRPPSRWINIIADIIVFLICAALIAFLFVGVKKFDMEKLFDGDNIQNIIANTLSANKLATIIGKTRSGVSSERDVKIAQPKAFQDALFRVNENYILMIYIIYVLLANLFNEKYRIAERTGKNAAGDGEEDGQGDEEESEKEDEEDYEDEGGSEEE